MSPRPLSKEMAAFAALVTATASAGGPALADLAFTSEPPTTAAVGQPYSYEMMAADISDDAADDKLGHDDDRGGAGGRRLVFIARALPPWLEFDGRETIFGTPSAEDIGVQRVRLRAKVKGDHVDQEFSITVQGASSGPPPGDIDGADLAASISVAPDRVAVGDTAIWRAAARNLSAHDVANFILETEFSGDAPFTIDDVDDESCSIERRGDHSAVVCRWSPLVRGASRSAHVSGKASSAGEVLGTARVSIADSVPTDGSPANDEARAVLSVLDGSPESGGPDSDGGSPVLTLNGASTITITVGETYEDAGATAVDDVDGDLTGDILVDNPVDTSVIGRYSVTYDVADSAGNVTTTTRTVEVLPKEAAGGGGGGAGATLLLLVSCCMLARRALRFQTPARRR
jgi:hypothetical protein